jgi:hypothetical protein
MTHISRICSYPTTNLIHVCCSQRATNISKRYRTIHYTYLYCCSGLSDCELLLLLMMLNLMRHTHWLIQIELGSHSICSRLHELSLHSSTTVLLVLQYCVERFTSFVTMIIDFCMRYRQNMHKMNAKGEILSSVCMCLHRNYLTDKDLWK